jgi:rhodanese-related sulfurtransferase
MSKKKHHGKPIASPAVRTSAKVPPSTTKKATVAPKKKPVSRRKNRLVIPRWIWIAGGAVLVVALVAAVYWLARPTPTTASTPAEISAADAYQFYQTGGYFLDVRSQEEWQTSHIPNSTLIPLDELGNRISEVPRNQEIVVVCEKGGRSKQGRDILREAGISSATCLTGGLEAWRTAGYPTESGS